MDVIHLRFEILTFLTIIYFATYSGQEFPMPESDMESDQPQFVGFDVKFMEK